MATEQETPETVQTVQETDGNKPERIAWFEVAQDPADGHLWKWCLWSGNGRIVALSPGGYERRETAVNAAALCVTLAAKAKFVMQSHV